MGTVCDICGCGLEWENCLGCEGEGFLDEFDDDLVDLSPGEEFVLVQCAICYGEGGFLCCPNAEDHKLPPFNA